MHNDQQPLLLLKAVALSVITTVALLSAAVFVFQRPLIEEVGKRFADAHINAPLPSVGDISIPSVVASSTPAVVSVVISADVPVMEQYFENLPSPFNGFFGRNFDFSVPRQRQVGTKEQEIGGGTGFFVSPDGYLVTNKHVVDIEDAKFSIVTNTGKSYPVKVVAKDPSLDIAILKADATSTFPYLSFGDPGSMRLGETVIAIGNALAEFPNSVSVGVISGLSRNIVASDLFGNSEPLEGVIQTDAAINHGNSGGPLLNSKGEVVGVNVAVAGNSENIGFALPSDVVKDVYQSVVQNGEILRPFLGIRYVDITSDMAKRNDLSVDYGILIARGETPEDLAVVPGSPADKAGLVENDIVLELDGKKLDGTKSFASLLRGYKVGDTISLTVLHKGQEKKVEVTLTKAPQG
jgi:S1-C subfamily serine protease